MTNSSTIMMLQELWIWMKAGRIIKLILSTTANISQYSISE